ncbi:YbaK/EbsC family protein [Enterococcus thailandicus]|uniref:YbaK/EbsC family protein n=1 Tax=Enterococcus TaxID=1350 RepID=UPI0022E12A36|nr:YbaK/EbsC family protein [Enterococcus thailandicus]
MTKTRVEQYLEEQAIPFEVIDLASVEETDFLSALAAKGLSADLVCKNLVLKGDKTGIIIALVPLNARLDYKKTREITKNHKVGLPDMDFVFAHTGYVHGANTPIGIKLQHPEDLFVFDHSLKKQSKLLISSGELGRGILLARTDLDAIVEPTYADLIKGS